MRSQGNTGSFKKLFFREISIRNVPTTEAFEATGIDWIPDVEHSFHFEIILSFHEIDR